MGSALELQEPSVLRYLESPHPGAWGGGCRGLREAKERRWRVRRLGGYRCPGAGAGKRG